VCCGGRPRERGIEAQKAPYTAPDRLGPGFEPPLTGVSWVGLAALGGTQYERYDPPTCTHASWASVGFVPSLLKATFYLASLVRSGSLGTSRIVPPLRLIDLSPFPRNEGGSRQEARHQPVLTASGLDLSHLLPACPGLSSRRRRCVARTFVRGVRFVRGAFGRVLGFGRAYETR
jgi:hypothetical protein